ncbi:hypothetical protein [Ascidiimonas sp. W6]|uniref:hypothetical protein n=1 Tax=Ascidiimonas meishanensis TaxID=3128903 RepID=UPI0030ED4938
MEIFKGIGLITLGILYFIFFNKKLHEDSDPQYIKFDHKSRRIMGFVAASGCILMGLFFIFMELKLL